MLTEYLPPQGLRRRDDGWNVPRQQGRIETGDHRRNGARLRGQSDWSGPPFHAQAHPRWSILVPTFFLGPSIFPDWCWLLAPLRWLQISNPFYLFQFYTLAVWMLQEYFEYSSKIIALTAIAVGASVWETRKVRQLQSAPNRKTFL